MLVEAYLLTVGDDEALGFLRKAAGVLAAHDTNISNIRAGPAGAKAERQARAWLRRNLTVWLAKYG